MNDGGPAFPADIQRRDPVTNEWGDLPPQGMTLRDWFAGQALAGLLASNHEMNATHGAFYAYEQADEMMKAREQPADAGKGDT